MPRCGRFDNVRRVVRMHLIKDNCADPGAFKRCNLSANTIVGAYQPDMVRTASVPGDADPQVRIVPPDGAVA